MASSFTPLDDDEVVFINSGRILLDNPTFKVGELLDALAQLVSDREADWSEEHEGWFADGADCEALRLNGSGWERGRIRLRVEFAPAKTQERLPEKSSGSSSGGEGRARLQVKARSVGPDELD
jgi:KGK domain